MEGTGKNDYCGRWTETDDSVESFIEDKVEGRGIIRDERIENETCGTILTIEGHPIKLKTIIL